MYTTDTRSRCILCSTRVSRVRRIGISGLGRWGALWGRGGDEGEGARVSQLQSVARPSSPLRCHVTVSPPPPVAVIGITRALVLHRVSSSFTLPRVFPLSRARTCITTATNHVPRLTRRTITCTCTGVRMADFRFWRIRSSSV